MTNRTLSHTVTGNPEVVSIEITDSYKEAVRRATVVTRTLGGLAVGSDIDITIGYVGNVAQQFGGTVKEVTAANLPGLYTLECQDVLWQALEYWFVPVDLDTPWSRSNITAEKLIEDVLSEALLTDYVADWVSAFTFATGEQDVEIKLQAAWDVINWICEITGGHVYADVNKQVHFDDIDPVPGAPTHVLTTGAGKEIIFSDYTQTDENLRNKVVVFGAPGIVATAQIASAHLPAGFFKTAIISHGMIDTQAMAQSTADLNLTTLNRLTEGVRCDIEGDPTINCRETATVTEAFTGVAGDWFILEATHTMSCEAGAYKTQLVLKK